MYKINVKNLKKGYMFGGIFLLVGTIFAIVLFFITFYGIIKKTTMDSSTVATYIDDNCSSDEDSTTCSPIYYFEANGKEYECHVPYSSSIQVSDNQNTVYYDSKNPNKCITDYSIKLPVFVYFLWILPITFMILGIISCGKVLKRIKRATHLENYGTLIQGIPCRFENTIFTVNGRRILRAVVDYTLPNGTELHLLGAPIYDKIKLDHEGVIDLLIDMNDYSNYYLDFNISGQKYE